jgi:hypothetical protein
VEAGSKWKKLTKQKGPEVYERSFWPANRGMDEIGSCHIGDSADGILSNTILMVSTDPAKPQALVVVFAVATKEIRVENPVVGVKSFDDNANVGSLSFEQEFTTNGVGSIKGTLRQVEDPLASMVHPNGPSHESMPR